MPFNTFGFYEVAVPPEIVAGAKRRADAADAEARERGLGGWTVLEGPRWHGVLGEAIMRSLYHHRGIEVEWDGGVNGQPDFRFPCDGFTGDVKTFTIVKGPFVPAYSVTYLAYLTEKATPPDGLIFCVYDEAKALMTVIGSCPTKVFLTWATKVPKGAPMASGETAAANLYQLRAERLMTIFDHLQLRDEVQTKMKGAASA